MAAPIRIWKAAAIGDRLLCRDQEFREAGTRSSTEKSLSPVSSVKSPLERFHSLFTEETGLKDFSVDDLVPALESLLNKYQSACSQRSRVGPPVTVTDPCEDADSLLLEALSSGSGVLWEHAL
jgi:hypothetical protein